MPEHLIRDGLRMLRGGARRAMDPDTVRISSNENPLGPCKEGLEAIAKVAPYGGRYSPFGARILANVTSSHKLP